MNNVIGDVSPWTDFFPDHLIPTILELVVRSWSQFEKPKPTDYEVPITGRFREFLRKSKDTERLPFLILTEFPEIDSTTGREVGRIDLLFLAGLKERVYFAFECKRLRYSRDGKIVSNAREYVGKNGMMCFVTGKYSEGLRSGGMIGYVMDGSVQKAQEDVKTMIDKKASELSLVKGTSLSPSSKLPNSPNETRHQLYRRKFILYHLFLALS